MVIDPRPIAFVSSLDPGGVRNLAAFSFFAAVSANRWSEAPTVPARTKSARSRWAAALCLGEVVRFHVDDRLLDGFRVDPDLLEAVGRMGGPTYARTKDRFSLERPKLS